MRFINQFIDKPVLAITFNVIILLLGLIALHFLPLRLFPAVEVPVISIVTAYPGAAPELVQSGVSSILENALSGVEHIDYLSTENHQGESRIELHMQLGTSLKETATHVLNKISAIRGQLPENIDDPVITQHSADNNPVMILSFLSQQMTREQVGHYLRKVTAPQIETIDGVMSAEVMGSDYAMQIKLDPLRMMEYEITPEEIVQALRKQNFQTAVGEIEKNNNRINLEISNKTSTEESFNNLLVKESGLFQLHLRDIGKAHLGSESEKITAFVNGENATMIFIKIQPGANPLRLAENIKQWIATTSLHLPGDMKIKTVLDTTKYIDESLHELSKTLVESLMIVSLVVFVVVRQVKAVLIPIVTIPLSLLGVCVFLFWFHYSINTLTLLAMVISIGLVVDDAIVVLENILRYQEKGLSLYDATLKGASEVAAPVLSMSVIFALIYFPLFFLGGITANLFREFALTLSLSVMLSGIVALTLTPMLCRYFLPQKMLVKNFFKPRILTNLKKRNYSKKIILSILIASMLACGILFQAVSKEIAPKEDQGFLQIIGSVPTATNYQFLQHYTSQLNTIFKHNINVERYAYVNGIPDQQQFLAFITLKPWQERYLSGSLIKFFMQQQLNDIAGLNAIVIEPSSLPVDNGLPVQFVLKYPGDYKNLHDVVEELKQRAQKSQLFLFIDHDLNFDKPHLQLQIDSLAAAKWGIDMQNISQQLGFLFSTKPIQQFKIQDQNYNVILEVENNFDVGRLGQLQIKNAEGNMISLQSIVQLKTVALPDKLNRFQKLNSVTLSGVMARGFTESDGLAYLKNQALQIMPEQMTYDFSGESRSLVNDNKNNVMGFVLAIIIVFLALSIQFNHYSFPLIILLGCVPLAVFAALFILWVMHLSLNIYSQIALLTLIGLISKHGILITQFARELQIQWQYSATHAVIEAVQCRLRPILMTTASMVLGVIPLLVAHGPGAQSRFQMGMVMSAGLIVGTACSLCLVPLYYGFFDDLSKTILKSRGD